MTIDQVFEFGKILGEDFYSPYISNVDYYGEGNGHYWKEIYNANKSIIGDKPEKLPLGLKLRIPRASELAN